MAGRQPSSGASSPRKKRRDAKRRDADRAPPRRRSASWLRLALFNVILIAVPLGTYFIFYVHARIERTTIRDFRALDSAADRLVAIIQNLPKIAANVPVGISTESLNDIDEDVTKEAGDKEGKASKLIWLIKRRSEISESFASSRDRSNRARASSNDSDTRGKRLKVMDDEIRQLTRDLFSSARKCSASNIEPAIAALGGIERAQSEYLRDFSAAASATQFRVEPLLFDEPTEGEPAKDATAAGAERANKRATPAEEKRSKKPGCRAELIHRLDETILEGSRSSGTMGPCKTRDVKRSLISDKDGIAVEVRDCRPLEERSRFLYDAMAGTPQERQDLDQYGVRIVVSLESLAGNVAKNVAPLFDQYVITDAKGRVLFEPEDDSRGFRYDAVTGAPEGRRVPRDFINQVDLRALVASNPEPAASSALPFGKPRSDAAGNHLVEEWGRYGTHSRVEHFRVADMRFDAFVQPFVVDGLDPLQADAAQPGRKDTSEKPEAAVGRGLPHSTVLYMVGIVSRDSLSSESLRLRLSVVADCLLLIGIVFASFSMLWLWTAGDRLMLGRRHLVLVFTTGLTVAFLYTLFAANLAARSVDAKALDRALETVSHRTREDFVSEVRARLVKLARATGRMLHEGKARVGLNGGSGGSTTNATGGGGLGPWRCRPGEDWRPKMDAEWFPSFDLAFLLDAHGSQWQCNSYRLFDTAPLPLGFRHYFERPRDGELWDSKALWDGASGEPAASSEKEGIPGRTLPWAGGPSPPPGFFMDRITSVLDGTTETVLSARPEDLCSVPSGDRKESCLCNGRDQHKKCEERRELPAAVIIGRLQSLEEAVIPPHIRLVVVDDRSGETLFHSIRSRALATNFVRETEGDKSLIAHIDAHTEGFVDLHYYGTSIRAYVEPLAAGVPWTLVVYRGHELEDTLGIMTVSATAVSVVACSLILAVALGLAWLILRRRRALDGLRRLDWLVAARSFMARVAGVSAGLLVISFLFLPQWTGAVAVLSICAGPLALGVVLWRWRSRGAPRASDGEGPAEGAGAGRRTLAMTLALFIATVTVLPTLGWFAFYRAEFSTGLRNYLGEATREEISERCERYRLYARRYKTPYNHVPPRGSNGTRWRGAFRWGWTLANGDDGQETPPRRCAGFLGAGEKWGAIRTNLDIPRHWDNARSRERLEETTAFSGLASDLSSWVTAAAPERELAAPGDVIDALLRRTNDGSPGPSAGTFAFAERIGPGTVAFLLPVGLLGVGLAAIILASLVDRFLGVGLRLFMLPEASVSSLPTSWTHSPEPLRACVIHRWETPCHLVIATLLDQRFREAQRAVWSGEALSWKPVNASDLPAPPAQKPEPSPGNRKSEAGTTGDGDKGLLHVILELEQLLADPPARAALFGELERLLREGESVLVCSRVLPSYWLARVEETDGADTLPRGSRWSHAIAQLDMRRLHDWPENPEERFRCRVDRASQVSVPENEWKEIEALALDEAKANPALLKLVAEITQKACQKESAPAGMRRAQLLEQFTAAAAGCFHEIWSCSTREEQLQLYALAHGGFGNPTQITVLSSLANRGLIETDGVIRLRSRAFGAFIRQDLIHDALLAWRDEGHGDVWRSIWPPVAVIIVLALVFFVSSTPEVLTPLTAILAAGLGAIPVLGSLVRSIRDIRKPESGG